jgi:hypothetical protein
MLAKRIEIGARNRKQGELPMRRAVVGLLTVILVGVGAAVVFAAVDSSNGTTPAGTTTEDRTATTEDRTTTTEDRAQRREDRGTRREDRRDDRREDRGVREAGEDISGPCDEAEHANDPRCTGVIVQGNAGGQAQTRVDVSGPCDEAEHANDPRCTGQPGRVDDDRGGVDHHGGRGGDETGDDDHSGSGHSGSGHGGDDDSGGDDHSGSGHGGGDDD